MVPWVYEARGEPRSSRGTHACVGRSLISRRRTTLQTPIGKVSGYPPCFKTSGGGGDPASGGQKELLA